MTNISRREWLLVAGLLVARTLFLLAGPGVLNGDGLLYFNAAQSIAQTGDLPSAGFQSRAFAVMLVPLLLVLGRGEAFQSLPLDSTIFGHPVAQGLHVLNVLADTAIVFVLVRLLLELLPKQTPALVRWLGVAAIALQPMTASWSNFVTPDHACMAAFFIGSYCVTRYDGSGAGVLSLAFGSLLLGFAGFLRIDMIPVAGAVLLLFALSRWFGPAGWRDTRAFVIASALFLTAPLAMMAFQYANKGEIGYVAVSGADNPGESRAGFSSWIRSWVMLPGEYQQFAFGPAGPDWAGYDAANYPSRAFPGDGSRAEIRSALAEWRSTGYSATVDKAFKAQASRNRAQGPAVAFLIAPALRTTQLWFNTHGGAAVNLTLRLQPPYTWAVASVVTALKIVVFLLALFGAYDLLRRLPRNPESLSYPRIFGLLALSAAVLRTGELGILGAIMGPGIMESRYVLVVWPCLLAVAAFGLAAAVRSASTSFGVMFRRAGADRPQAAPVE